MADGTLKIEILSQNLIPDVTALQVLKHPLNRLIVSCNEETHADFLQINVQTGYACMHIISLW